MPQLDEGAFLLQTVMPPDTALEEVDRINHRVEDVLRKFDDVEDVVRRTGRAERTEDPMPHVVSDVLVVLKPERSRDIEALEARCARRWRACRASRFCSRRRSACASTKGSAERLPTCRSACSVPIWTSWPGSAARPSAIMADVDGIEDLRVEAVTGLPQMRVTIDRQAVARAGLTPGDVVRALRVGLVGEEVSEVWVGQRRYDLVVRLADPARNSVVRDPQSAARGARRHADPDRAGGARRGGVRPGHDPPRGGEPPGRRRGECGRP